MERKKIGQRSGSLRMTLLLWRPGFAIIKMHPRVILSLIHVLCSVSSNHTYLHIWLSSLFNSYQIKRSGPSCSVSEMQNEELRKMSFCCMFKKKKEKRKGINLLSVFILLCSLFIWLWPRDDFISKIPRLYGPHFVRHVADTLFIINDGSFW